jgi:hypothetical protein
VLSFSCLRRLCLAFFRQVQKITSISKTNVKLKTQVHNSTANLGHPRGIGRGLLVKFFVG